MYNTVLNNAKELETYSVFPPSPPLSIHQFRIPFSYLPILRYNYPQSPNQEHFINIITYSTKVFTINTIVTHTRNPSDLSSTYLA